MIQATQSVGNRSTFTTSRRLDFWTLKEFQQQSGVRLVNNPACLVRELVDNSLDACESAGVDPEITVTIEDDWITVEDNGPGLPESTLIESLDYETRTSSNAAYVGPTRGQQGNALKLLWAAPYVVATSLRNPVEPSAVEVRSQGKCHQVSVCLDEIMQKPVFSVDSASDVVTNGTFIRFCIPDVARYFADEYDAICDKHPLDLIAGTAFANRHASFKLIVDGDVLFRSSGAGRMRKWPSSGATSVLWYTLEDFKKLAHAQLRQDSDTDSKTTTRAFVGHFDGLKRVARTLTGTLKECDLEALYHDLRTQAKPVSDKRLGSIGRTAMIEHVALTSNVQASDVKYAKAIIEVDNVPHIIEAAASFNEEDASEFRCDTVLNWSYQFQDGRSNYLEDALDDIEYDDPVRLAFSIISPRLEFTDRGKTQLALPEAVD